MPSLRCLLCVPMSALPGPAAPCVCSGMGWTEGKAIGRGAKEEVKAKELVRWASAATMPG